MNRHLSRTVVLQTLFAMDFAPQGTEFPAERLEKLLRHIAEDAASRPGDFSFMKELVEGVRSRESDLNLIIEKAAPEWPINRISPIDRNILRIGLYELLFADRKEVPAKVAINEAIELAKVFGGDNSSKFINGVLGAVYKELGEPGKDEVSKKKKKALRYEDLTVEELVGAVVYAKHEDDVYLALVHDIFGHWTLSKGRLKDPKLSIEQGTIAKVKEELGLEVSLKEKLGENEYLASDPELGKKRRHVTYFLAESPYAEIKLGEKGGLDDAKWFKLSDTLDLNFYDDMVPIITKAVNSLLKAPAKTKPRKAKAA